MSPATQKNESGRHFWSSLATGCAGLGLGVAAVIGGGQGTETVEVTEPIGSAHTASSTFVSLANSLGGASAEPAVSLVTLQDSRPQSAVDAGDLYQHFVDKAADLNVGKVVLIYVSDLILDPFPTALPWMLPGIWGIRRLYQDKQARLQQAAGFGPSNVAGETDAPDIVTASSTEQTH